MSLERDAQIITIIGRNGTGKSTVAEKIVRQLGQRTLIVTEAGLPKIWRPYAPIDISKKEQIDNFTGFRQVFYAMHEQETYKHLSRNFRNGVIVFDDCRNYLTSNIDTFKPFKALLINYRHLQLDMVFVVHSPAEVPARLWSFTNTFFIGATGQMVSTSRGIDVMEKIFNTQKKVNELYRQAKSKGDNSHYGIFKIVKE